jgi:predicted MFS family arabinose efflux permease
VLAFAVIVFAHDHQWQIYLSTGLLGIGFGFAFTAMSNIIVSSVPPEQTGVASGMNANIRTIGGSLGAAFMASIVTAGASPGGVPKESGYVHGFLMLGGAVVLATVAALLMPAFGRGQAGADPLSHPELALVPAGTLVGDEPE